MPRSWLDSLPYTAIFDVYMLSIVPKNRQELDSLKSSIFFFVTLGEQQPVLPYHWL